MRFFTKEWYNLMQGIEINDFKKIPDGNYTDAQIDALYQKALKKEIASERRCYNSEPFFLPFDELLTEENFDPEDWIRVIDEEKGIVKHSESAKEVREELEAQYRQEMDAFENRPPFDPAETIQFFETAYQTKLHYYKDALPAWMTEQVDRRLLALDLLPESAYRRYREESREKKKEWNQINRTAKRTLSKQNIPENVEEALQLHDAALLSLKKSGKNYIMLVAKDGFWPDDATPYRRVIFHKATVIEKEAGLRVQKLESDDEGFYRSNTTFLYKEIYRTDTGYEVHMMFWMPKGLAYLTIACEDISFEDGVLFEK
jgi:hypothetical protein